MSDRSPHQDEPAISTAIRAVLNNAGVPKKEHCRKIASILDLTIAQVYKKLSGKADWSVSQVRQIETEYNASLMQPQFESAAPDTKPIAATLVLEDERIAVLARIGNKYFAYTPVAFVAVQVEDAWEIHRGKNAPSGRPPYRVEFLQIDIAEPKQFSIAVLDDDAPAADTVKEMLQRSGYAVTAFYSLATLAEAIEHEQFDCYVLDWKIGASTSEGIIASIRASENRDAPIFLLSGKFRPEREEELSNIVLSYHVKYLDKPIREKMLAAFIGEALWTANKS